MKSQFFGRTLQVCNWQSTCTAINRERKWGGEVISVVGPAVGVGNEDKENPLMKGKALNNKHFLWANIEIVKGKEANQSTRMRRSHSIDGL